LIHNAGARPCLRNVKPLEILAFDGNAGKSGPFLAGCGGSCLEAVTHA